jgi:hypothetical protein
MRSPVMWSRIRGINDGIDESLRILLRQIVSESHECEHHEILVPGG